MQSTKAQDYQFYTCFCGCVCKSLKRLILHCLSSHPLGEDPDKEMAKKKGIRKKRGRPKVIPESELAKREMLERETFKKFLLKVVKRQDKALFKSFNAYGNCESPLLWFYSPKPPKTLDQTSVLYRKLQERIGEKITEADIRRKKQEGIPLTDLEECAFKRITRQEDELATLDWIFVEYLLTYYRMVKPGFYQFLTCFYENMRNSFNIHGWDVETNFGIVSRKFIPNKEYCSENGTKNLLKLMEIFRARYIPLNCEGFPKKLTKALCTHFVEWCYQRGLSEETFCGNIYDSCFDKSDNTEESKNDSDDDFFMEKEDEIVSTPQSSSIFQELYSNQPSESTQNWEQKVRHFLTNIDTISVHEFIDPSSLPYFSPKSTSEFKTKYDLYTDTSGAIQARCKSSSKLARDLRLAFLRSSKLSGVSQTSLPNPPPSQLQISSLKPSVDPPKRRKRGRPRKMSITATDHSD
ncbi:unnamed protein product [Moneuplotes crassus]|uniref:Uncharacterized protein n=1 Tax=Euplotes crassus TaxID=5936 RepID=A0AAD1UP16_EUPCR|nr:unnamed protein product [Moneuplotes crassus]